MSVNYGGAEGSERGFTQLAGQKKNNAGMAYLDLLTYNQTNANWEPAGAASLRPFGFCGALEILTHTENRLTGVVTTTRGAAASDTHCSVITKGFIKRAADGAIPPGKYVMPSATNPLQEVQVWNGTSVNAIVGRYVRNITQHDNMALPAAADNDIIQIEFIGDQFVEA